MHTATKHINFSINVKGETRYHIVQISEIIREKKRGTCRSLVDHMICRNNNSQRYGHCFAICKQNVITYGERAGIRMSKQASEQNEKSCEA